MTSSTKLTAALIDVAMGRVHADLVIKNGNGSVYSLARSFRTRISL